jgi:uncharacterized protein YndB with AHSA1/START domain
MSTREVAAFRLERTFAATPEEVFDAWTNPAVLERWWAREPTWTSPGCDVDLREGGSYTLRMQDERGELHVVGGEYREVVRPHRLVYTWSWQGTDGPHPGHVSLVTVEFHDRDGQTQLVLEHSGLASEQSRVGHGEGWNACLDILQARVFDPN